MDKGKKQAKAVVADKSSERKPREVSKTSANAPHSALLQRSGTVETALGERDISESMSKVIADGRLLEESRGLHLAGRGGGDSGVVGGALGGRAGHHLNVLKSVHSNNNNLNPTI